METWRSELLPTTASFPHPVTRQEGEVKDPIAARKVQKADREKLRRDRLNDQFLELGCALDPERPKNDKATILADTIQVLKDLTAEVNKLKAECAVLNEESRELTQEKNELKEEKAVIKSEIENLNIQYQQRLRVMFPWSASDVPVIMAPPPYPYPVPVAMAPGPIPMHAPPIQPFPYFGSQSTTGIPTPCSTFIPYQLPVNPTVEHPSVQHASSSHVSSHQSRSSNHERTVDERRVDHTDQAEDSNNVATDLELKMPGSSSKQELFGGKKGKLVCGTERSIVQDESSSSRFSSSSLALQDNSSSSVGDIPKSGK